MTLAACWTPAATRSTPIQFSVRFKTMAAGLLPMSCWPAARPLMQGTQTLLHRPYMTSAAPVMVESITGASISAHSSYGQHRRHLGGIELLLRKEIRRARQFGC